MNSSNDDPDGSASRDAGSDTEQQRDRAFVKPARFAAALRYREHDQAPVVVAKGDGFVADEIVKRAIDAGVPIHASKELAALMRDVPLDHAIPPQMYRVIAELLAWVYQLEHALPAQLQLGAPAP